MKKFACIAIFLSAAPIAWANPMLTDPAATLGQFVFKTGIGIQERWDEYGSPRQTYDTVMIPVYMKVGAFNRLDLGFNLTFVSHSIERGDARYKGSSDNRLAPEFKFGFNDYISFRGIWHMASAPKEGDELPIVTGADLHGILNVTIPTGWPIHLNAGYVHRGKYSTDFGVVKGATSEVEPGNITEGKAAIEVPLPFKLRLLNEWAYYHVDSQEVNGVPLVGSAGEALDVLVGLSWHAGGFVMSGGAMFGLLEESHTSFDVERGAGDVSMIFQLSYQLRPRPPQAYQ